MAGHPLPIINIGNFWWVRSETESDDITKVALHPGTLETLERGLSGSEHVSRGLEPVRLGLSSVLTLAHQQGQLIKE